MKKKLSFDPVQMFRNLHSLYTDAVCNPFYVPGEPLDSR